MTQSLIKQLGEYLQRDLSMRALLLLDPSLRDVFPDDWAPFASASKWIIPIKHPALREDQMPLLVELEGRNSALLQASVIAACAEQSSAQDENEGGFAIRGWLLAQRGIDAETVARHLAACMRVASIAAGTARMLRLQDRRVFEWMWPALSDSQQAALLGPLVSWIVLDRTSQLRSYEVEPGSSSSEFLLELWQIEHAQQSVVAQDLLRGWAAFAELPAGYLERVTRTVEMLSTTGLKQRQDLTLLGAYILQVHPRLTAHPRIRSAIEDAVEGRSGLSNALGLIPDPAGWDSIRDELIQGRDMSVQNRPDKEVRHG